MLDSHRLSRQCVRISGYLVLVFLLLPILAIIPLSFNSSSLLTYPMEGISLQWYARVFADDRWISGLKNSLLVGLATVVIATPIGTLAAIGLAKLSFRGKALLIAGLLSPMIVPTIITAVGIYFVFSRLGLANSLLGLVLAHVVLALPFVLIPVSAALSQLDPSLGRAAASLGARPGYAFRHVTLPLIAPGMASGAIFAFTTSFDEVVIAMLLTGPAQRTLPRELLSGTRENLDPTVLAVATLLVVLASLVLVALGRLSGGRKAR